jgi:hypothetical protein
VENFELEAIVAAIIAGGTVKEADPAKVAVDRYRRILREIQQTGGLHQTD